MPFYKNLVNKISISPEKKTKQKEYLKKGVLPIIDQGQDLIGGYTNQQDKMIQCELPVIIFGDHTRCVKYIDFPFGAGADGIKILQPKSDIKTKYLFYATQYLVLRMDDRGYARHYQYLEKEKLIVPPIAEQERIVARIEELFSQLDKAVETLQVVKEQLVVYRQAVLKDAFEGKLTEFWRVQNLDKYDVLRDYEEIKLKNITFKDVSGDENEIPLILPQYWKKVRLGEIFNVEVGGTPKRAIIDYWNGNVPWVSSGEVHFNRINYTEEAITQKGLLESSTKLQPKGTVLLAMIGEGKTRGQAAILDIEAAHNQNIAAIQVSKTPCSSKYIYYFFELNYENVRRTGSGNNQKALNKERVKAIRIPFTSFNEQKEIVRMIDMKLSINESIDRYIDDALEKANAMRQSILKQAFEGELV